MAKRTNEKHGKHEKYFRTIKKGSKSKKKSTTKTSSEKKSSPEKEEPAQSGFKTTFLLIGAIVAVIALILLVGRAFDSNGTNAPMQTEDGILVASVNDENIYSDEIEKRLNYYQAQYGPSFTEDMVLNQTINEVLLLQEAEEIGISVNQGEIDKAVNDWLERLRKQVTDEQLEQLLNKENLTMEEYVQDLRDSLRRQMLMQKLLNQTVISKLDNNASSQNITVEDAREAYDENPDKYNQVKVSHILVCYEGSTRCESNRSKAEAEELAQELYNRLLDGEDFAKLAKEHSDGPSAENGGELNAFTRQDNMADEFTQAAFSLNNKNQFTSPVETEFGYHIIKLLDKKDSFEELQNSILMQLQFQSQVEGQQKSQMQQQEAIQEYLDELKEEAEIEYHRRELTEGIEPKPGIKTFNSQQGEICKTDGKPVVYFFSSSNCPHCSWVSDAFDDVAKQYMQEGKIQAYHWELDTKDNKLTEETEESVPSMHQQVFQEFSTGGVPTFVFGCKYYRVGTAYEGEAGGIQKEKEEFEAVIEELLK